MKDVFFDFLQNPGRESYLKIRDLVVAHPSYNAYARDLDELAKLYGEERYDEMEAQKDRALPNYLLSPRLHLLAGLAARKRGDERAAEMEFFICSMCLEGILSTGDGSEERPYLVLRTTDEYDVLQHLDKTLDMQELMHKGERSYDVMNCQDGSVLWFDITDAFATLARQMEGR
jgi:hypothetical protein